MATIDLKEQTMEQLKSMAYDFILEIERHQQILRALQEEIAFRNAPKENLDKPA